MKDFKWHRALDFVEPEIDHWLEFNAMFRNFIPEFDNCFDRGIIPDLNSYVVRDGMSPYESFEAEFTEYLFSTHQNPTGKAYMLIGKVGSGKTTLVRYMSERIFPYNKIATMCVHIDTWKLFDGHDPQYYQETLETVFKETIEDEVLEGNLSLYKSQRDFFNYILKESLGFTLSDDYIMNKGISSVSIENLIKILLKHQKINRILIIIDNIDENPADAISTAKSFSRKLAKAAWRTVRTLKRKGINKQCSVLMTVREYSTAYLDTVHFAKKELPPIDGIKILKKKLEQSKEAIASVSRTVSEDVPYTIFDGKEHSLHSTEYKVSKKSTSDFLQRLLEDVDKKEIEAINFIKKLSAGNLKIMVENMYFLLHSNKLPLIPLFRRVFTPDHAIESKEKTVLLPYNLVLECLCAIHYPFYDVNNSNIINIFNAISSRQSDDYQNTLIIPRILALLNNTGGLDYESIIDRFCELGYDKTYTIGGLNKILSKGLIDTSGGIEVNHFSPDTYIRLSTSGILYIKWLIYHPSYLQYICEDTPMPSKYIVPIEEKYSSSKSSGAMSKRLIEAVNNMILFVKEQEQMEKKILLERYNIVENAFLGEMSVQIKGHSLWLHEAMGMAASRTLTKILAKSV